MLQASVGGRAWQPDVGSHGSARTPWGPHRAAAFLVSQRGLLVGGIQVGRYLDNVFAFDAESDLNTGQQGVLRRQDPAWLGLWEAIQPAPASVTHCLHVAPCSQNQMLPPQGSLPRPGWLCLLGTAVHLSPPTARHEPLWAAWVCLTHLCIPGSPRHTAEL